VKVSHDRGPAAIGEFPDSNDTRHRDLALWLPAHLIRGCSAGSVRQSRLRDRAEPRVPKLLALLISATVMALVVYDGESNREEGAILIGLYLVIASSFWWAA
jgi:hypothetical protein